MFYWLPAQFQMWNCFYTTVLKTSKWHFRQNMTKCCVYLCFASRNVFWNSHTHIDLYIQGTFFKISVPSSMHSSLMSFHVSSHKSYFPEKYHLQCLLMLVQLKEISALLENIRPIKLVHRNEMLQNLFSIFEKSKIFCLFSRLNQKIFSVDFWTPPIL